MQDSDQKLISVGCPRRARRASEPCPPPPEIGNTNGGAAAPTGTAAMGAGAGEGNSVSAVKRPASTTTPTRTIIVMARRLLLFGGLDSAFWSLASAFGTLIVC